MSKLRSEIRSTNRTTKRTMRSSWRRACCPLLLLAVAAGCGADDEPSGQKSCASSLAKRAYVVSLESDELTVIDLTTLEITARVPTHGIANHMAGLNADFSKVYVSSNETNETIVVDANTFQVVERIAVGRKPGHMNLSGDGTYMAVMNEEEGEAGAISFIDTTTDKEVKRLGGFFTPHFMRFSPDGRWGYVANIGANHITRVDMQTLELAGHIPLEGFEGPPNQTQIDEGGFADVQIDSTGILYAAHRNTGRVMRYDTNRDEKLPELAVGRAPWVVFAEHPFKELPLRHLVPNFGDRTVSMINGAVGSVTTTLPGDEEAYGVNYSSLTPDKAFVMNRVREDVAVVDTSRGEIVKRIDVGGNTETAATTADGRWIIATVSSADRIVVIDAKTNEVVKSIEQVGNYPWSVLVPCGQHYCH